ncbi:MAG: HAMP domain-containing protein [Bacteroidaceae bacterium]|nr:HAMP domain-containing protein [Bacteroidaceae bacterium]
MRQFIRFIRRTLSVRLSLTVVFAIATLLLAALLVMFLYSRRVIKDEVLQKAQETLECTVQRIDNILLSAELASGNMINYLFLHLDDPDQMYTISKELVENNRYIKGCAIAMEPYFYKDKGELFMAYYYTTGDTVQRLTKKPTFQSDTFGDIPYNQQIWYTKPWEAGAPIWIGPIDDLERHGSDIITFGLPLSTLDGKKVAVMGVDVSVALLSEVIKEAKPSPNSYAMLINGEGDFIVHPTLTTPDSTTKYKPITTIPEEIRQPMLAGETGYKKIKHDGHVDYIFYKPFVRKNAPARSMEALNWSIAIVYPEDDIMGDYNRLLNYVMAIAIVGMILLLVLCQIITHHQLSPLLMLAEAARRIANGKYDEPIPDSPHMDEVGRLQDHFKKMQRSLAVHISELEKLNKQLQERNETLQEAYEKATEADRMKIAFLHNMTNKMQEPIDTICERVEQLSKETEQTTPQEADQAVKDIERQCMVVVELLNNLLKVSEKLNYKTE